jgi:hypothetical protein
VRPARVLTTMLLQFAVIAFLAFVITRDAAALPSSYSGAAIRGRVIDAETNRPLAGVHVVAHWRLQTGVSHGRHATRLEILETVTDEKGDYYLPAWGPKPRPSRSALEWGFDPMLMFFKAGYLPDGRRNYNPPPDNEAEMSHRYSLWDRKTIALEPFRGTMQQWATHLSGVQIGLGWGTATDDVIPRVNDDWKYMPRIVLAVLEECRRLPDSIRHLVSILDIWNVTDTQLRALVQKGGIPR